jgi:putative oxidoreductase
MASPSEGIYQSLLGTAQRLLSLLDRVPFSIAQFLLRVSVGAIFWDAGLTKIKSWSSTVALFQNEYHVPVLPPDIAAAMAAGIELICPVLLVLGLGTRLATIPMLVQTLVIEIFVYPEEWVEHLTWIAILLVLLLRGPGAIALDALVSKRLLEKGATPL